MLQSDVRIKAGSPTPLHKPLLRVKKTASFGKSLGAQRLPQIFSRIWQIILHETDDGEVMKMLAHYTDPLKDKAGSPTPLHNPLVAHSIVDIAIYHFFGGKRGDKDP